MVRTYAPKIHDGSESFIADIYSLDGLVQNYPADNRICEKFVRIMSEVPHEAIRLFFPELAKYAFEDVKAVFQGPLDAFRCILPLKILNQANAKVQEEIKFIPKTLKSPITITGETHNQLIKDLQRIIDFKDQKFSPFLNAINQKNYSKALRCACTSSAPEVLILIDLLFKYKNKLNININEQVGENNFAAIHYAATKSTKEVYERLIIYGANPNLRAKDISAVEYAQNRFGYPSNDENTLTRLSAS